MYFQRGSLWLDSAATDIPKSALKRSTTNGPWRRIVEIVGQHGLTVPITGMWQEYRDGAWHTITERRAYASTASFGRKYTPLTETKEGS